LPLAISPENAWLANEDEALFIGGLPVGYHRAEEQEQKIKAVLH
jgi:hypothetical protein